MRTEPNRSLPLCPVCESRHLPATLGNGARVWCDGSNAEGRTLPPAALDRILADLDAMVPDGIDENGEPFYGGSSNA